LRSSNFEEKGKMDKNAKNLQPIPAHGDYRKLGSYQMVKIVYDVTVLFCDLFISKKSRTMPDGLGGAQWKAQYGQTSLSCPRS